MGFLNKKNIYPAGLDISEYSIKLAQIKKAGNKLKIQALSRLPLEKGIIEDSEIKDQEKIIQKIKEIINKPKYGSLNSNNIVLCLPDNKSFIKLIEIEKSLNNLSEIIPAEIEKHVPLSTKEIFYDWQLIKETEDKYFVLIGAAPQKIINQYLDIITEAGLTVIALEPEAIAICRSLLAEENPKYKAPTKKNYALIDIGAYKSSLIIYSQNTIILTISIPISGEDITEKIAKTLQINREQAEKAKIICGFDKTKAQGIICQILSDMVEQLNQKIKNAFEFYADHYPDFGPINEIIISGGGANIKLIDKYLEEYNKIPVYLGNPFINLHEDWQNNYVNLPENPNKKILKEKSNNFALAPENKETGYLSYAPAFGLALRQIFYE